MVARDRYDAVSEPPDPRRESDLELRPDEREVSYEEDRLLARLFDEDGKHEGVRV